MSKEQKLKILVLIKSLGLGGAERLIVDSLAYLDREQFDYHFAYCLSRKNFLVPQIEAAGFPVHCLGMRSNLHFPLMLPRLNALSRRCQFDLIHADMPQAGILARLIGRWQRIPVIYTEHNLQERFHPITRYINGLTYGWNKQVLAVSQEVARSIAQWSLDRHTQIEILLNGVPVEQVRQEARDLHSLRRKLDIPENHLIVGTVAVFRKQKRLQDWLDVAACIANQRDDVIFLLVGDGPENKTIRERVQRLGLADRIRMPGFRPDGRRLMGLMDIYLMTSEHEGLPIAMLEAMTLGKPTVSTAVGGIPELIQPGKDGYLVPVNAIGQLADKTLLLLANPYHRSAMGQRGANKVETKFHLKHRVQFIEQLYREILQSTERI